MTMLRIEGLSKSFTLHTQGGVRLPVLADLDLDAEAGECVALTGPSGIGKSTVLRCIYANYRTDRGRIAVWHDGRIVDMATAHPLELLSVRRMTIGYASQFLRVIPRVPAIDVVAETLANKGVERLLAARRAAGMLRRLNLPQKLQHLAPATFSGGEQQRVNLARVFVADYPILLLDEPTASLDRANRDLVVDFIVEARNGGAAIIGIFHDREVRDAVATRSKPLAALYDGSS